MEKKRNWTGKIFRLLLGTVLGVFLCGMCAMARTETVSLAPMQGVKSLVYIGKWDTSDVTVYHKLKLKKSSMVRVFGEKVMSYGTYGMNVTLCNKNKNSLEKYSQYISDDNVALYMLPKGTYYLKTEGLQTYYVAADVQTKVFGGGGTIKDGGASKAKAKTLAAKKKVTGIIGVGEKTSAADWYKFKISKSQYLNFTLRAAGPGSLNFTLYGSDPRFPKGQISLGDLRDEKGKSYVGNRSTGKKVKVSAGTYYIKVTRSSYSNDITKGAAYLIYWK